MTYVLWATKVGLPDWEESMVASRPSREELAAASAWAVANGFDRLRLAAYREDDAPNFAAAVNV